MGEQRVSCPTFESFHPHQWLRELRVEEGDGGHWLARFSEVLRAHYSNPVSSRPYPGHLNMNHVRRG